MDKKSFSCLPIIISIIAVIISWKSCSNSQEAIRLSRYQFTEENRPFLQLKPVRIANSEDFLSIKSDNKETTITLLYEMTNTGKHLAKDIKMDVMKNELNIDNKGVTTTSNFHDNFTLGQFQPIKIKFEYKLQIHNNDDAIKYANTINSELWKGIYLEMILSYSSALDNNTTYTTELSNRVWKNKAMLVKSVMK